MRLLDSIQKDTATLINVNNDLRTYEELRIESCGGEKSINCEERNQN